MLRRFISCSSTDVKKKTRKCSCNEKCLECSFKVIISRVYDSERIGSGKGTLKEAQQVSENPLDGRVSLRYPASVLAKVPFSGSFSMAHNRKSLYICICYERNFWRETCVFNSNSMVLEIVHVCVCALDSTACIFSCWDGIKISRKGSLTQ